MCWLVKFKKNLEPDFFSPTKYQRRSKKQTNKVLCEKTTLAHVKYINRRYSSQN